MKSLKEQIEVMEAASSGAGIQCIATFKASNWVYFPANELKFNWVDYDYRIKQEPLELWIDVYAEDRYEVASDKNRLLYENQPVKKMVKMREVIE